MDASRRRALIRATRVGNWGGGGRGRRIIREKEFGETAKEKEKEREGKRAEEESTVLESLQDTHVQIYAKGQ